MTLCDMHTHSSYSPDADRDADIGSMAETAARLGLEYITVTDHCDCNFWYGENEYEYPQYQQQDSMMFGSGHYAVSSIREAGRLKEKYPQLLCGVELGQPLQNTRAAEAVSAMKELDLMIGSLHMNTGKPDFYWLKYGSMSRSEITSLLEDHFDELLEMCRVSDFDVLGHLTYPLRYIVGENGIDVDMNRYTDIIREIFTALIERGKGIEINTSGLRQKYGRTFPELGYVKLFRSLGGEIITLGSDAHKLSDIGAGLNEGAEIALEAGFRYTAVFKQRRPEFIKLG